MEKAPFLPLRPPPPAPAVDSNIIPVSLQMDLCVWRPPLHVSRLYDNIPGNPGDGHFSTIQICCCPRGIYLWFIFIFFIQSIYSPRFIYQPT